MEENLGSDKKLWSTILVCFIGAAIFFSVSRGYTVQNVAHIAFNVLGLLVLGTGLVIFIKGIGSKEEPGAQISASLWLSICAAEQIKANDDKSRSQLQDALNHIREDVALLRDTLPTSARNRIRALEEKQWGIK